MNSRNGKSVLNFLRQNYPNCYDDDLLSDLTGIRPRQQINSICRRLKLAGLIERWKVGNKIQNRSVDISSSGIICKSNPLSKPEFSPLSLTRTPGLLNRDEASYQSGLCRALRQRISQDWTVELEGALDLGTVGGTHRSDILISQGSKKLLNVEIKKYGSAVTDAFKARSWDAIALRRTYNEHIKQVLVYYYRRGTPSTISIERARQLSLDWDVFIGIDVDREALWERPVKEVEKVLSFWDGGSGNIH